jgi:hypothetical protein
LDDEQRLLEEETAAMDQLDTAQQEAYFRAKGLRVVKWVINNRVSRTLSS